MPFKIVRNDIPKMNTEAIVNTANDHATVGTGCDYAVYMTSVSHDHPEGSFAESDRSCLGN